MRAFARYSPATRKFLRVWANSWERLGWEPRLYFGTKPTQMTRKTDVRVTVQTINFSLRRGQKPKVVAFGRPGWMDAPLVRFPLRATEWQILNCGRSLC